MALFSFIPADLAPGDSKSATLETAGISVEPVRSLDDPLFEIAYARLWEQFGAAHEVESREVLGRRLTWDAAQPRAGFAMCYDLLLVRRGGEFAAVRDHEAIADARGVVVHLSHLFVDPAWRRGGLAGWMRALPIQSARRCLALAALSSDTPITLVGEMEYPDGKDDARTIRLGAYERAGFRKIDPAVVDYWQPDFRPPAEIDASGGPQPLRFQLIVRRVDREEETVISGAEVRMIVERLYAMYAQEFRPQDMAMVWPRLDALPPADARIVLLPPTA
jgi:GNAT superfamily N-acetyltransferase